MDQIAKTGLICSVNCTIVKTMNFGVTLIIYNYYYFYYWTYEIKQQSQSGFTIYLSIIKLGNHVRSPKNDQNWHLLCKTLLFCWK